MRHEKAAAFQWVLRTSSARSAWRTRLAVVRLEMRPDLRKIDEPVDLAKQVIVRDMALDAEAVGRCGRTVATRVFLGEVHPLTILGCELRVLR